MEETMRLKEAGNAGRIVHDSIPTRESLLSRLKNRDDDGWRVFFETYWRFIYNSAIRAGLNDSEAQDVVQETVLSVFKSMPDFKYDRSKWKFKAWLMRMTQRRIVDARRKMSREPALLKSTPMTDNNNDAIDLLDQIPDSAGGLAEIWDAEWEANVWEAAMERVKRKVDLKHYQIFDLFVFKHLSALEISRTMEVNPARVYFIKHKVQKLLKRECDAIRAGDV